MLSLVAKVRNVTGRSALLKPLALLVPLAMCAAILFCRAGTYFGDDAATYVDAAHSLLAGQGYVTDNEIAASPAPLAHTVLWPPGYSFLVASIAALGVNPVRASWWIGLMSYAVLLALCMRVAQRSLSIATASVTGALLMLNPRLWEFATDGLSDVPFAVAIMLAVLAVGARSEFWRVALVAAATAVAVHLRYVGIFMFPAVIAVALFARTRLSLRQALVACTLAGFAITPLLIRNFAISATVGGERAAAGRSWLENLSDAGVGTANLLLPGSALAGLSRHAGATVGLFAGLMLTVGIVWFLLRTSRVGLNGRTDERDDFLLRVLSVASLSYLVVLVLLRSVISFDPLTTPRMLLPLLPLLALLAAQTLVDAWSQGGAARGLALGAAAAYFGIAVILGVRGQPLRLIYPDISYVANSIRAHVPDGSCLAYEAKTSEAPWAGRVVRMLLPGYRAVEVPEKLVARAGRNLATVLSEWGQATGCHYFVSVAVHRNGREYADDWTFQHNALNNQLRGIGAVRENSGPPIFYIVYDSSRVSILQLISAHPYSPEDAVRSSAAASAANH